MTYPSKLITYESKIHTHTHRNKGFKAILMLCLICLTATVSFSQNANTLPPTGNIGVGTTTPSVPLDVVGNTNLGGTVVIDSTVVIKDSLTIQKRLTIKQDIKVVGKSVFVDDVKAKANLRVLGVARMKDRLVVDSVARMKNKLVVDGLTRLNGDAKVFGDFKLPNLTNTTNPTFFLTTNPNGKVFSLDKGGLLNVLYQPQLSCLTDQNGNLLPVWKQNPNPNYGILYTGTDCPAKVGIGTGNPLTTLDVRGGGFFSDIMGINIVPSSLYQVDIKSPLTRTAGIHLFNNHPTPITTPIYGVQNVVDNDNIIAYSVTTYSNNQDVFRVMGNGTVYTTKVVVQETPFPDYVFKEDYNLMTLPKLEEFIKKNNHLPNMPNAEKVDKYGADLGEINRILVEKVEELTLYTIQQQKSINALTHEIEKLKNK